MVDVINRVNSLLSGGSNLSPLFNLGVGLLGAAGPSAQPRSTGQRIASGLQFASGRGSDQLRNQIARERLSQALRRERREVETQQSRRDALGQLRERLGTGEPLGQGEAIGLLSQIPGAEGQIVQNVLSQLTPRQPRPTGQMRNIQEAIRLGVVDPKTEQGQDAIRKSLLSGRGEVSRELLTAIELQIKGMQVEKLRSEREVKEDTLAKKRRGLEVSVRTDIQKLQELAQLNKSLRGTLGETGTGFEPMVRLMNGVIANTPDNVASALGVSKARARTIATNIDRFKKLTSDLSIESLDRFRGTGAMSNNRFNTLAASLPSIRTAPGANSLVIADLLQGVLDGASVEQIPVGNRKEIESVIKQLRGEGTGGGSPGAGPGAPAITPIRPRPRRGAQPGAQGTSPIQEGTTATNPGTGERLIFRNGRWERIQ